MEEGEEGDGGGLSLPGKAPDARGSLSECHYNRDL